MFYILLQISLWRLYRDDYCLFRFLQHEEIRLRQDLHKKAKTLLENLTDEIKQIKLKLEKPAKDIDSLGGVMSALEEIRKKQSDIALQFKPINDMYALIDTYFSNIMEKDEIDSKTTMQKDWELLVVKAESTRNEL